MLGKIVFVVSIIVAVVFQFWVMPRIEEYSRLSEKLEKQKHSYLVKITLLTGIVLKFQWHSDYLYKSVTELLKKASEEKRKGELTIFYNGKEIVISRNQIVLMEMEGQNNETEH